MLNIYNFNFFLFCLFLHTFLLSGFLSLSPKWTLTDSKYSFQLQYATWIEFYKKNKSFTFFQKKKKFLTFFFIPFDFIVAAVVVSLLHSCASRVKIWLIIKHLKNNNRNHQTPSASVGLLPLYCCFLALKTCNLCVFSLETSINISVKSDKFICVLLLSYFFLSFALFQSHSTCTLHCAHIVNELHSFHFHFT